MEDKNTDNIRKDCWNIAFDCCGYSYIFLQKRNFIKPFKNIITLLGIIMPIAGGALSLNDNSTLTITIITGIVVTIGLIQLITSSVFTILKFDDSYNLYSSLIIKLSILEIEFKHLATYPLQDYNDYLNKYELLLERVKSIAEYSYDIKDKHKRKGHRYALRQYQRACAGCNQVPTSIIATDCYICGKF